VYILGISCFYHDSAAALLRDGELVAASMEERFSRIKHDPAFPQQAIAFCLQQAGIHSTDLDYVVFYEKPFVKLTRILLTTLHTFPSSADLWRDAITTWLNQKLWIKNIIRRELDISNDQILFCDHHVSHAASAFFASPFRRAAVLTVDGVGEWTTTALGTATSQWQGDAEGENKIELTQEQRFPHSLGLLYSTFTSWLGFRVNNGEYKVMGMAPYGTPRYIDRVEKLLRRGTDGSYQLNMDYFNFHQSRTRGYSRKFLDLFGQPRPPDLPFFASSDGSKSAISEQNQYYADVAASIQHVIEQTLIDIANYLHRATQLPHLVMAGGVALNTKANYRLLTETPFEEIYIQPAAGDDGGALGAALWAYHCVLGQPRNWVMPHAYWGKEYTDEEYKSYLDAQGISYTHHTSEDDLLDTLTEALTEQKVIGWMQGRAEWGPRALGNRSILADPRHAEMKEIVNTKIKYREPFRPFAPVILSERAADYVRYPGVSDQHAPRYMLMVAPLREDKQEEIPAVNHEGTARLQVIERETNPLYYGLIERFGQATGVPVLLNTSFNLRGEPIVNSPQNAFRTFRNSDIDILVLGTYIVHKRDL